LEPEAPDASFGLAARLPLEDRPGCGAHEPGAWMARLYGFKGMEAECFVEPIRDGIAARFKGRFILLLAAHL
jgi:hypothetical protein